MRAIGMTLALVAASLHAASGDPASPTFRALRGQGEGQPAGTATGVGGPVNTLLSVSLVGPVVAGDGWSPVLAAPVVDQVAAQASVTPTTLLPTWPSDSLLAALRWCESTDDYGAHLVWGTSHESRATGGYQFEQPTWDSLAAAVAPHLVGVRPHLAAPQDQDAMARWLWQRSGPGPWPHCGPIAQRRAGG